MEAMGGGACFLDEEWESLYKIFSFDTDLDLSQLLAHNSLFPSDPHPHQEATLASNSNHFPQSNTSPSTDRSGSSNGSTDYANSINHSSLSQFDHFLVENGLLLSQGSDDHDHHTTMIERPETGRDLDNMDGPDEHQKRKLSDQVDAPLPKKKARVSKNGGKGKRKMQPRKKKDDEFLAEQETICDSSNVHNSSRDGSGSDNESNDSEEVVKKKRASRGAATDPQSLYARRRREKINERLRILQTLVPNGTKVDISTMLEEAVHYVKFLQLQIKLLSSDEMWMYAPLAYNGFDIDFYNRFTPYF